MDKNLPVSEILIKAKAEIANPARWTREAYARDEDGQAVDIFDTNACQFCAIGAIRRQSPTPRVINMPIEYAVMAINEVCREKARTIYHYNDQPETSHEDIIQIFDATIRVERAKEALANDLVKGLSQ
jgi:hypothetical protein